MNILLLNWIGGENNPFTLLNNAIEIGLKNYGCIVKIFNFKDDVNLVVEELKFNRYDLAITHQG